jgi:hypothetical protein
MANFNIPYKTEREGQIEFFDNYGIPYIDDASVLVDNTDGVYNGNIIEFKLSINNLNRVLFQAIKYLSKMRIKGESVPATILLVDLNSTTVYAYKSEDYRDEIQKVYTGAASKNNEGFVAGKYDQKLDYSNMVESAEVKKLLKGKKVCPDEMYMPIDIDEGCIVGWAERYYREKPSASKGDFLGDDTGTAVKVTGEIRDPRHFKGLINPYTGKSNEKFKYLMDCLNDRLSKKDLGAFYTPVAYAKKAAELVQMAVDRVPDGNDYIILDRCAGTGNLEAALIGLTDKNGNELIEHCVVSTYEYYEYKVLSERIGDKVRDIIPPSEANVVYENGKVANADAMSKEFIENPLIKRYVDDDKCTIILFENPPYRDASAANKTKESNSATKQSFVANEMAKKKNSFVNTNTSTVRDLTNQFVWSSVEYYLRKPTDSYVLFSPVKWWKSCGIVSLTMAEGFIFNRRLFHASESAITCCLWINIPDDKTNKIKLTGYETTCFDSSTDITISKCYKTLSEYYQKKVYGLETVVFCESDGTETKGRRCDGKSYYSDEIICYLTPKGFTLDANNNNLVRMTHYNNRGTYATKSNYLSMLPLFVAKEYPRDKFYEKGEGCVYFTTSDGGDTYTHDAEFLKSCLLYTCLSNQNKCLSFNGSDGRYYRNELCFDATNGDTVASADLAKMTLDADEVGLVSLWNNILDEAKKTENYDSRLTYGIYQITKELNTSKTIGTGKSKKTVYDYPVLNGYLDTLRTMLKAYYKSHITEKMFKYELLK